MKKRIGFCCKWLDHADQVDGIGAKDEAKQWNTRGTTVAWLNRQTVPVAEQKLWDLMEHNIESIRLLVEKVGDLDPHLRMVRLGSDILPVYTEPHWGYFYHNADAARYAEKHFARVGDLARERDVRLSFHPGQFCVLASDNPDIVNRSIEEFEYHATMARWMGFGQRFQDLKINVHISGRQGPEGIRRAYTRLSPEARNCIAIENEEIVHGVNECLTIQDIVPITLDIHHNFIREGEYIDPNDDRVRRVVDSWRGVRPTCHYSVSREDVLVDHDPLILPEMATLLEQGFKKQKMRAHSNFMWNKPVNEWAYGFWENFDVMVEAKAKNLASFELAEFWKSLEE